MQLALGLLRFLGSFRLSVAIFALMTLITWLGTLSQESIGLYQSQKLYFESWFVTRTVGDVTVPFLPGGWLLMTALFVNLVVGGIVQLVPRLLARSRGRSATSRALSGVGIVVTHLGIVALLLSAFVTHQLAEEGAIRLHEGESAAEFVSYHDWEVVVQEVLDDGVRQFVIPHEQFADRDLERKLTARADELPFRLVLFGFAPNAQLRRAPVAVPAETPIVDGFRLQPIAPSKEWELNVAGLYARAETPAGEKLAEGILWGLEPSPMSVATESRTFGITLRKRRTPMPFRLRLEEFTHEFHPGTRIPREFSSRVTVLDGNGAEPHRIRMNEPLRRDGLVVFQSSFGPTDAPPDTMLFSGFSVVENPADRWPWYSLYVIAFGLTLHFSVGLVRFLTEQARAREEQTP